VTSPPPPGWYADPGGTPQLRWWDGNTWTANLSGFAPPVATQPVAPVTAPAIPPQAAPYGYQPVPPTMRYGTEPKTVWQSNPHAMRAMIVTAIYLVIAITTPLGLLGIVPILASGRSFQAGEKLAPYAMGAAALALIVGIVKLTHH
jgi:hypothetical protein